MKKCMQSDSGNDSISNNDFIYSHRTAHTQPKPVNCGTHTRGRMECALAMLPLSLARFCWHDRQQDACASDSEKHNGQRAYLGWIAYVGPGSRVPGSLRFQDLQCDGCTQGCNNVTYHRPPTMHCPIRATQPTAAYRMSHARTFLYIVASMMELQCALGDMHAYTLQVDTNYYVHAYMHLAVHIHTELCKQITTKTPTYKQTLHIHYYATYIAYCAYYDRQKNNAHDTQTSITTHTLHTRHALNMAQTYHKH